MAEIDAAIIQADALQQKVQPDVIPAKPEVNLSERRRLIVHLGRLFSRRYEEPRAKPSGFFTRVQASLGLNPGFVAI